MVKFVQSPIKILSLDTSGNTQSVALLEGETLVACQHQAVSRSHTEILIPTIQKLLEESSWNLSDLNLIALTHGPGSFTGLRIGISTVKGLVWDQEIPIIGVDTLKVIAASLLSKRSEKKEDASNLGPVLAVLDARMNEVYAGVYAGVREEEVKINTVLPPQVISVKKLLEKLEALPRKGQVLGSAWQVYPELLKDSGWSLGSEKEKDHQVQAYWVGQLAFQGFTKGEFLKPHQLKPQYLRASTAESKRIASEK